MKTFVTVIACIMLLSFVNIPNGIFTKMHELTGGTWVMTTPKGKLCEQWKKLDENTLVNRAFKVAGPDTTWLETVRLEQRGNAINYISTVANENEGKPVSFTLIDASNDHFTFSNPSHDFPQRIIYHFVAKDSLHAWIEGKYNGKEGRKDFYYKRN
jgi:hypothetical protein